MSLIEPKDRPYIACPKCGQNVVWPEELAAHRRKELAAVSRRSRLEGVKFAHSILALDLREAKALALHVTNEGHRCHRCGSPVVGELSVCTTCRSANLDW
jgi:uncharacterized OB-fold protein